MRSIIVAVAAVASSIACPAMAQAGSSPNGVLSAAGARYVFGQLSDYAKHQFMLDTQTGRLWRIICVVDEKEKMNGRECLYSRLDPVFYDDNGAVIPDSAARMRPDKR